MIGINIKTKGYQKALRGHRKGTKRIQTCNNKEAKRHQNDPQIVPKHLKWSLQGKVKWSLQAKV